MTRKTKLYGGVGLGLVLVALVFKLLVLRPPAPVTVPPPVVHRVAPSPVASHAAVGRPAKPTRRAPAPPAVDPTLPAPLRLALRHHPVVVAVLYAPGVPGDNAALASARSGAAAAHAGFAALNVHDEKIAEVIATKLPGTSDPSVLVVRRPGDIRFLANGYLDGAAIAQAAHTVR
ncbi:MAG TPA: hypothetical protein VFA88_10525 [Gaiellaceae bacterium]|nr:hypothetical protein [Gaiellaceae bacterium]